MAQDHVDLQLPEEDGGPEGEPTRHRRRRWPVIAVGVLLALLAALALAWATRETIVGNVIGGQLAELGVPATYEIESINPGKQVLRDVVIGDPRFPDLTIERVETQLEARFGAPTIGRITLVRPQLHGQYRDGQLSFGSLDPLIFTDSKEPFSLPDIHLSIIGGRALLETDAGPVGVMLNGRGEVRNGFAGRIAAAGPALELQGCRLQNASLYGEISVAAEKPHFVGPLRLGELECAAQNLSLAGATAEIEADADRALSGVDGRLKLTTGAAAFGGNGLASVEGLSRFTFRKGALTARYDLEGKSLSAPQFTARTVTLEGQLRGADGLARIDAEGSVAGSGLELSSALAASLAEAERGTAGTLAAPVFGQLRTALLREGRNSSLSGSYFLRRTGDALSLVVPSGTIRGGSGQALLSLSRVQVSASDEEPLRIAGNFASGGEGLPRVSGRMERPPGRPMTMRVSMPEYSAGTTRLALPSLMIVQLPGGGLGFAGEARLSGDLPGGYAENLALPIEGNWSDTGGLAMWRKCVDVRFDQLVLADLTIDRRQVRLCPPAGSAIVRSNASGMRIAAGAPELQLAGSLGETPIRIESGPVGIAWPGRLAARALDVTLGPAGTASRFRIADLSANVSGEVAGTFGGTEVFLESVPLDVLEASGDWRYSEGVLAIDGGAFRLEDRQADSRFQPLIARDATLRLEDNRIAAAAELREPTSGREVVRTDIRHDLSTGHGGAELFVEGLRFDKALQPDMVTRLALGVIANADGVVEGRGSIRWDETAITSTGTFSTDSLDFAAALGPVQGLSGTVRFTDLLGLVTAPDQYVMIASMNPGIEVNDGRVVYELGPDLALAVKSGAWPFLGGELTLAPTRLNLGVAEERRYTLTIRGLDSAKLVDRMDLENMAVTGTFDGVLPLLFDQNGGRVVDGYLESRPPGGNVAYVGELTYKDLSAMANFAFDALKSMNYGQMRVDMNGSLEGEMVTRVVFDGITQGEGASRNILTRRIAKLPIRFRLNIRAPFFQLATSLRSYYDPAFVRDPRSLGLLDSAGRPLRPLASEAPPLQGEGAIQPSESGDRP